LKGEGLEAFGIAHSGDRQVKQLLRHHFRQWVLTINQAERPQQVLKKRCRALQLLRDQTSLAFSVVRRLALVPQNPGSLSVFANVCLPNGAPATRVSIHQALTLSTLPLALGLAADSFVVGDSDLGLHWRSLAGSYVFSHFPDRRFACNTACRERDEKKVRANPQSAAGIGRKFEKLIDDGGFKSRRASRRRCARAGARPRLMQPYLDGLLDRSWVR
jgi:hypothetical protein